MSDKALEARFLQLLQASREPVLLSRLMEDLGSDISVRTARRWLGEWVDAGLVERTGVNKGVRYRYCAVSKDHFRFLEGLDGDIRQSLLKQIRDLWTHSSTAMEGNTLSLGDTHFLLEEGLTVSGKPMKDHQEVLGHAQAIALIYQMLDKPVRKEDVFALHVAIQTAVVHDIFKPNGAWKREPNGTYIVTKAGSRHFIEYAQPREVEKLMGEWIAALNYTGKKQLTLANAPALYAKMHMGMVHIHPFWDGNGRMARLLANIPLLRAGLPPLMIPQEQRREYIQVLADYQLAVGQLTAETGVWPSGKYLKEFEVFCGNCYKGTIALVEEARALQRGRGEDGNPVSIG